MTRLGPYEVHPFADRFPMMEGDEFDDLVESIREHGNRHPILVSHDRRLLIDGRNRLRACEKAGRAPSVKALPANLAELDILTLIRDLNLERRQLNAGQRGGLAQEWREFTAAAIKAEETARKIASPANQHTATRSDLTKSQHTQSPKKTNRNSAKEAAKSTGASETSVKLMAALKRDAPDLYDAVMAGNLSLDAADKQRKRRIRNRPKPEPAPKPAAVMLTLRTHEGAEVEYPKPASKATFNETKGDGISWAAWSWNPVTGCLHGCEYCYARDIATNERFRPGFPVGFTPLFHHERLDAPRNTTVPATHQYDEAYRRVFVCSMADLYGRWVPDDWISAVHDSMLSSPQWQYILLTKFPARYPGLSLPKGAWVGTSVDEQKRVRIAENAFRQIEGVRVKWLSLEPLREPLEFSDLSMFDWVVIGAQTETRQPTGPVPAFAPPAEWVVRITHQALEAGCKVHWKPNLRASPGMQWLDQYPDSGDRTR